MTRPTRYLVRARLATFAAGPAFVGFLLAWPAFTGAPLAFTEGTPRQDGRIKITVHVLTAEGGDPLPGIRVNFENLATGNRGFRVSKEGGLCDGYFVQRGTRLQITPASRQHYFGEAGSDGIMKTSLVVTADRDRDIFFKGADRVSVPDLSDMTYSEAQSAVQRAGLSWTYTRADPCRGVLTFGTVASCRAKVDKVFDQKPPGGRRVAAFSNVEATVGAWPAPREIPQVSFGFERGGTPLSAGQACHRLLRAGFLTRIANVLQRGCRGGDVTRQNPAGGTRAVYGSVVELVLCGDALPQGTRLGEDLECSPRVAGEEGSSFRSR